MRFIPVLQPVAAIGIVISVAMCQAQTGPALDTQRQAAIALEQQGENAEAEAAWRAILRAHPASAEPYAHLGLLEAQQEHYSQAIPLYRRALALGSAIPGLRLNLGLALFKSGQTRLALEQFSPLLKRAPATSPDRQRLTILVGMCHYGLGEYRQAAPFLKEATEQDPKNLPLLLALAHSYLWSKQYQDVLATYHQILLLDAESAEADMLAGEALDELKNTTGAIEQFRAAAKADPHLPNVHFGLGYLLWTRRQYSDAISEFQAELENNPNHAQALAYLADSELELSHPDVAGPLLEKAVRIDPKIELAHLDLGTIDADAGRHEEALQELALAEKLAPNDVNVHWRLGRVYRAIGKREQAQAEFDKAKSITQAADTALINKMAPPSGNAPLAGRPGK